MSTQFVILGEGDIPRRELRDALTTAFDGEEDAVVVLVASTPKLMSTYSAIADRNDIAELVIYASSDSLLEDIEGELGDDAYNEITKETNPEVIMDYGALSGCEVLVLLESPDGTGESELTKELLKHASASGYRIRALNQQLFDIDLAEAEEESTPKRSLKSTKPPKADEDEPKKQTEVPDLRTLMKMSRNDIKQLGKDLGVKPTDWRSTDSIIDAIVSEYGESPSAPVAEDSEAFLEELQEKLDELKPADEQEPESEEPDTEVSTQTRRFAVERGYELFWDSEIPCPEHSASVYLRVKLDYDSEDPLGLNRIEAALVSVLESIRTYDRI